jgi:hypothetical protein
MSGRRRAGLSPNLFPFLAVLICTLGTLILMLAMVAQNAGEVMAAAKPSKDDPTLSEPNTAQTQRLAEAAAQLERGIREARWHREQSVKVRESQTADLEERRDRLAHLEDHSHRLREELESLTTEVEKSLEKEGDVIQVQQTLDQVLADIELEKAAVTKLTEDLQTQTPRIVIVPHKGPNGTDRRPVYIECRADGIYLQPGDRRIPSEHLEPIPGMPNPLDAALRSIRYYAMKEYGDAIAPYPLLIIRPDGIAAYAVARAAMHQWDDQFGYELLPADVELAFPAPDAALDSKVAMTIRQAIDRRNVMLAQSGGRGGGGSGRYGNGSTRDGTSDLDGRPGSPIGNPNRTFAQDASGSGYGGGSGEVPNANAGLGPNAALASTSSLPALSTASMSRGDQQATVGQLRPSRDAGQSLGNPAGPQGVGNLSTNGSSANGSYSAGTSPGGLFSQSANAQATNGQRMDLGQQPGLANSGTIGRPAGQANLAATNRTATGQPGDATAATPSTDGSFASGGPNGSGSPGDSAEMTSDSERLSADAGSGDAAAGTGSAGTGTNGSLAASSSSNGASGAAGGTGGSQATGSATPPPDGSQTPSVDARFGNTNEPPPVTRVGRDWALPPQSVSGPKTEMLRTIRVECHPDRFVLLPEGGRGEVKAYSFADGDIHQASMKLATDVRERVRNWGTSIPGSRWQPVLDVIVAAGAQPRFEQMRQLYDGSGLVIEPREAR